METYYREDRDLQLSNPVLQFLLYAAVVFIPFYRWRQFEVGGFIVKLDWIVVFFLGAIVGFLFLTSKRLTGRIQSNVTQFYLMFFLVNLISSLISPYPSVAFNGLFTLIIGYLFILFTQVVISETGFVRVFPVVLCLSISLSALLSVVGFFFQVDFLTQGLIAGEAGQAISRGVGGSIGANNSALMYLFVLPILVHWAIHGKTRFSKFVAICQMGVILLGIVSTMSRGGFLMLILVVSMILWTHRHHFSPQLLGLALAGICGTMLVALAAVPDSFYQRQATLVKGARADMAMSRRTAYLKVGWKSFGERPILGKGTDTFRNVWFDSPVSLQFKRKLRYAHNTYMEILVGSGLVGLAVFLALLLRVFFNYTAACRLFREKGMDEHHSLASAYRLSFLCVCAYLMILSAIEHKLLLLALAFAQISLNVAQEKDCY